MTKEELLRTYLEDEVFTENKYIKKGEAPKFNWSDGKGEPIIEVLKTIIKEEAKGTGERTIIRLANKVLDNRL
jgi:hypothetical protein